MCTEYEHEKELERIREEVARTRKEFEELKKRIERSGIGPEDDWELREEYNDKSLAYAYASIALDDYLNYQKLRRFHGLD